MRACPRSGSLIQRATYEMAAPTGGTTFSSNHSEGNPALEYTEPIHFSKEAALFDLCAQSCPTKCSGGAFLGLFKALY